jgi:diguanylate cyclase (GGDEF)-like protein
MKKDWHDRIDCVDFAFQPIVNMHTGVCYGYEALLRNHEAAGFPSIRSYFDRAFADGVLHEVDLLLREKLLGKFAGLKWKGRTRLFYNLDNRVLNSKGYRSGHTLKLLEAHGFKQDAVCFEISERHELVYTEDVSNVLKAYRSQGFKIAVDDCGTGFAGLQLLYYTEPDFIKIDRFFIQDIPTDQKKRMFVSSMVNIAHLMGSTVICEGVETRQEYYICRDIGCDLVQGYLVQRPQIELSHLYSVYEHVNELCQADQRKPMGNDRKLIHMEMESIDPIDNDCPLTGVFEQFRERKDRTFFPVVNGNQEPIGIIREMVLKDFAYSRFGRQLLENPAYGKNIDRFITRSPIADIHTPIEKLLEIYSVTDSLEGIVIVDNMKYAGFLSARSLLKVLNEKNLAIARDQNPLTRLPGNTLIHEYVSRALEDLSRGYFLVYLDFDNFKPYNDTYGFRHGDRVIQLFSDMLKSCADAQQVFVGHIGGDDFFMGIRDGESTVVRQRVLSLVEKFRRDVESFYDAETIRRGFIMARDRDDTPRTYPLLTVSAVILELPALRTFAYTSEEIGRLIASGKKHVKASPMEKAYHVLLAAEEDALLYA